MVNRNVFMSKFKGKFALSDFFGMQVLTFSGGIIARSLSNPKHLSISYVSDYAHPDSERVLTAAYEVLGSDLHLLNINPWQLSFTFPEGSLDRLAKSLRSSKRGIIS